MSLANLLNEANKINDQVIDWRRHFHKHPELPFQEEKTSEYIYQTLLSFGNLEVSRPTKYSVMARIIGDHPGKVLALRADIDALAIQEENEFDFKSQNPGVMHACGHDAHTAMLLGVAKILSNNKDKIKGEVRFLFQHAEELLPGGAQEMVKAGVMDGVDYVIAQHVQPKVPTGEIELVYGPFLGTDVTFDIKIIGKGGHASQPHLSVDPIAIASQVVINLQHIVSRNLDPLEMQVITVTEFHAGTSENIIPDAALLKGTIRSLKHETRDAAINLIEQIVSGVTSAHGASHEINYTYGYAPVVNDFELTKIIEQATAETFGEDCIREGSPALGGDDFSAFSEKAPGCYIHLGSRNEAKGIVYPGHHPKFTIDEDCLEIGVKLLINATLKVLNQH